jgi:hypothetical protein
VFGIVCVACVVVAIVYVGRSSGDDTARTTTVADDGSRRPLSVDEVTAGPFLALRDTGEGDAYGSVAVVPAGDPSGARAVTPLSCDRVHMASGTGMCLRSELGVLPKYEALVFDDRFAVQHRFDLAGLPSRTQVSPDGSRAAYTVFVTGHSYADGAFSTRTAIIDTSSGAELVELEAMSVSRDGEPFAHEDFNFWGVSFTDDPNRFYATLQTQGQLYLVEGDVDAKEMRVVTGDVECPSLSPDGTRIAYKERIGGGLGPVTWRIAVLDLATGERWRLAETRDVDDQVEWLDDATVMYGIDDPNSFSPRTDVWAVPADGSGEPQRLIDAAWSPVFVASTD